MSINYYDIRIFHFIILILQFNYGITKISISDLTLLTNSCANISIQNRSSGVIHSLYFYSGQYQPPNVSCSWILNNPLTSKTPTYIFSLRVIELENDPSQWSNELTFWTGKRQISVDDIHKRTYLISSSSIQIYFRTKPPLLRSFNPYIRTNLRIRRFLIEFANIGRNSPRIRNKNYFHCLSNGIYIPTQWKCNCIFQCSHGDNCPLCSIYKPLSSLLCQSNEIWCLPNASRSFNDIGYVVDDDDDNDWMESPRIHSRSTDPKGVCVPRGNYQQCSYSTMSSNCEKILAWRQDYGQILLNSLILDNYQLLCFIIIAQEEYRIKLFINQYQFIKHEPDLEMIIYDGSEQQSLVLISSNWFSTREIVQTRESHIATIIIRNRSTQSIFARTDQRNQDILRDFETKNRSEQRHENLFLLNITWLTSICSDDQMLCGGNFETKCYTKQQRCDGIWDCINGDDEFGCSPESCPTSFSCHDRLRLPSDEPQCFTWSERCNGNAFCANRTDEALCSKWWCNSNNGTFLCSNLNCIYETWVCDGTDDCGDHSDEMNCPSRVSRRMVTAAVIGVTICSTLFIIALGCTCKLFHLRTAERRATSRLFNPQCYVERHRQEVPRERERHSNLWNRSRASRSTDTEDNPSTVSNDTRRMAPPSYNQTMGYIDENEERGATLVEHLRLAGLANYITLSSVYGTSRISRHRHRRHQRHRHRHRLEGSRVALLEPTVVVPNNSFSVPSTSLSSNRLHRFRSRLRSLFTTNHRATTNDNTNSIQTNSISSQSNISRRHNPLNPIQPMILSTRSHLNSDFIQAREPPPLYGEEQSPPSNPVINLISTTIINSRCSGNGNDNGNGDSDFRSINPSLSISSLPHIRKRQIFIKTLRDCMRQLLSTSTVQVATDDINHSMQPTTTTLDIGFEEQPPIASIKDDEQPSSDDGKVFMP